MKSIGGIASGPDGKVYLVTEAHEGTGLQSTTINVYVFDRQGKSVRRLLPPPGNLPPEKSTVFSWVKTDWGTSVPLRSKSYIMHSVVRKYGWANVPLQTPAVTPGGKFVFLVPDDGGRKEKFSLVQLDIKDGSTPPGSIVHVNFEQGYPGREILHLACSPDGKWLYISGGSDHFNKKVRTHAVWRMAMDKPGEAKVFLGSRN